MRCLLGCRSVSGSRWFIIVFENSTKWFQVVQLRFRCSVKRPFPALLFMPVPNLLKTSVMSFRCWCVWSAGFCITASSVRFLCIEVGRFFQYAWGRRKSNPAASASWKLGKTMFLTSGRPTIQNSVEFFLHYVLRTTDSGPRRPSSERTMSPGRQ